MEPVLPVVGDLVASRYRIVSKLGTGGFGVVYHARQESMGRDVAIKFLSPEISNDPVAVERFRREAFNASGLRHPNTIILHDYGQSEKGLFYIVMELLEGEPLSKAISAGGGLSFGRCLRIGRQILRSLAEAHQRGLVHRDLKPENIFLVDLLGEEDFVKVLDFGLSKATANPDPALTQEGVVFGTPLYMAPEQAYGEAVVPASDLFAFGLLLYEMLVGERPFSGRSSMEVLMKLTQEPLPRLPAPLEGSEFQVFLDKLTEKEVVDRIPSAAETLPLLEKFIRDGRVGGVHVDEIYVGKKAQEKPSPPEIQIFPEEEDEAEGWDEHTFSGAEPVLESLLSKMPPAPPAELLSAPGPQYVRQESPPLASFSPEPESHPADEPGSVSIDLKASQRPKRKRARFGSRVGGEIKTIITQVDVSEDSAFGAASLDTLRFHVPLAGREEELQALEQRAQMAARGQGGFLLMEGEAGIGKSRLLDEFQRRVEDQGAAVVIRGAYLEGGAGQGTGLREAVERLLGIVGVPVEEIFSRASQRLQELGIEEPDFARMLIHALRPGLAPSFTPGIASNLSSPQAFRVLERLLVRASFRSPIILVMEDLHWADSFTLGFAEYLVSSLQNTLGEAEDTERLVKHGESLPLLCICTVRRDQVRENVDLVSAVQNMKRFLGRGFVHFELEPLEEEAVREIMHGVLPLAEPLIQRITRIARGNPLHVLQMLQYLAVGEMLVFDRGEWIPAGRGGPWPVDLKSLLYSRVEQAIMLAENRKEVGALTHLMCVLGARFQRGLLEAFLSNLGRADLLPQVNHALGCLTRTGILVHMDDATISYRFKHLLFFEVLSEQIRFDPQVPHYHKAAADAKERARSRKGGEQSPSVAWHVDLARHWEAAGDLDKAIEHQMHAARLAERSLDLESARELYHKVENVLAKEGVVNQTRASAQLSLGALHLRLGEMGPAEDILQGCSEMARSLGNLRSEGRALICTGRLQTVQSRYREALRSFRRAVSSFKKLGSEDPADLSLWAEAQLGQAEVARLRGELEAAENLFQQALQRAQSVGAEEVEAHCLHGLGRIAHVRGNLREALAYLRGASDKFERDEHLIAHASVSTDLGLTQLFTHGRAVAEDTIRRALSVLHASGECLMSAHAHLHLGLTLRRSERLDEAEQVTNEAIYQFERLKNTYGLAKARLLLGELCFLKGDFEEAYRLGQEALAQHEELGDAHGVGMSLMFLGFWTLERGDLEQAEANLRHAIDMFNASQILLYLSTSQIYLGLVAEQQGQLDFAFQCFSEGLQGARQCDNREAIATASASLGGLSLVQGRLAQARGYFQNCLQVAEELEHTDLRGISLFGNAWIETLHGNVPQRRHYLGVLVELVKKASGRDFYFREWLAAITRAIGLVRGSQEAARYRATALDVMQQIQVLQS